MLVLVLVLVVLLWSWSEDWWCDMSALGCCQFSDVGIGGGSNGGVSGSVVALAAHWWWLSALQMISPMA